MRSDTEQCQRGCPDIGVIRFNVCPWSDSDDEAVVECSYYRHGCWNENKEKHMQRYSQDIKG